MEFPSTLIPALGAAIALVGLGEIMGTRLPLLQRLSLPGAVIGGLVGLALGPQVIAPARYAATKTAANIENLYQAVGLFPALFINVVFACLMLGKRIEGTKAIWRRARAHVVMGHVTAWGQYVVGLGLALVVLAPFLAADELVGVSIAVGFQGGHGTAAGLQSSFVDAGFPDGPNIAYALATLGIVFGTVFGPLLGQVMVKRYPAEATMEDQENRDVMEPESALRSSFSMLTGRLTLHLGLVGVAIALGWFVLQGAQSFESLLRPDTSKLFTGYVPLFSVVLLAGLIVQLVLQTPGWDRLFDRSIFESIGAFGLDLVVVSALMSISLRAVADHWLSIIVLALGGVLWNMSVFFWLGPRLFPRPWYVYALGDLGGATATTATGILLIRVTDPEHRTHAQNSYSEKQPFYEPLMGGGLVTALALPMVAGLGALTCLMLTSGVLVAWLVYAVRISRGRSS